MGLPIIFSIDDDPQVLRAISRDLKSQYRDRYRVLSTSSVSEAMTSLVELQNKGEEVAIFVSDQRMPEMQGVDFLEKAMAIFPFAKRVLLTAYSDTDAAIKAINDVQLDYYLMKPWDPPEEKLFPAIDELLHDWQANYRPDFKGIKVIGYQFSPKSHEIKDFLAGNLVPYQWMDANSSDLGKQIIKNNGLCPTDFPTVILEDGTILKTPSLLDVASHIGLNAKVKLQVYDVVIIGAGPAGLAASVYGASEGLSTLLIERKAPGGQAGTSSRIENYLGFPAGLSGSELTRRAITQATRFGTEFLSPQSVKEIKLKDQYKTIVLEDETEINARAVVITTGVDYRKLETKGIADFTGKGIYYGAASTEASSCGNKDVYVLGGGNSAGQAAMYLSKFARNVYIIVRKTDLTSSMSSYLIDQIKNTENVSILGCTEIVEATGNEHLEGLRLVDLNSSEERDVPADALFIFIGARPYTDWVGLQIIKNNKGFIETGRDMKSHENFRQVWKMQRDPYLLETSSPGIFAAGDVRAGAMNRVTSAVGEGSMSISFVHQYLSEV
ncbi:FAD-dependent oxidoreductase [Dyadobacter chenwenxiniae]|uniref:FAD-dependent oxidoreductase n=1 Tax=Dyadobacter chenwenxiniae TaxID=2906456 RepID=A0A9X1PNB4_9BACT|nr:response regulator [Dyadobacter chenwenxiniae]MCF0050688.1 FAD-dependent oxidoreductase [Dyadobacter chenwenxiniae]MCF0063149.1 FAD-dependent oxidoreductase [Dyadobacter chenwenxiniae]UON84682.1 FAD-dependent oxidoreductase [Dyadobacter chenwenxiniae]